MYNNILRLVLSVIIFLGFFSITYQVFFYFKKDNQLNFNYVLDNINDSQAANAILSLDNGRDVTVTNDLTPRIAFWPGKANQHINQQGYWISDYDDAGGHPSTFFSNDYGDRPLEYCKKWYPQTLSVRPYKVETIETWRRAKYYEQSNYTRVVTSIECVQSNNNDSDLIIQNPPTISLSASPNPVQYGNIVDLNWNVTNATSCTGSNGWTGNKNANGGAQSIANMTANTTFILTCTGPGGTVSNSVYVPVNQPVIQNPPTISLSASPNPVQYGNIVDLNWNVTNATSCTGSNGWTGNKNANGGAQSIANMTANTTFILTCTGPGGTVSNSVYVPVNQPVIQNPPTISLSASPNPVQYGNIVDLNWNVTNATSCTGSNGWTGNKNANGGAQSIANMTANTTFILTCTGPGGTVSNSVYVPVNQPVIQNPPTISLSASPNPVQYGNIVDLNWNVTNATSCTGSNGWTGNKNANGGAQSIANMTANTTFILTCTGPGGTVSNSVYVPVNQPVIQNPPTNNSNTVISPVSNTQTSCPVFTKYLKKGDPNNDRNEVKLWQAFLNKYEGFNLVLDGVYGGQTEIAIRAFQTKYKQFVLIPWGITEATGYTYKTTRAYANFLLGCPEGGIYLDNGVYINFR